MASEHQHFWGTVTVIHPPVYEARSCRCGAREQRRTDGSWEPVPPSAEQQLAQAREENIKQDETIEFLHIVNDDLKTEVERWQRRDAEWTESNAKAVTLYAEARSRLELLAETEPVGYGAESSMRYCPHCDGRDGGSDSPESDPVEHAADCPWLKARAFLARKE